MGLDRQLHVLPIDGGPPTQVTWSRLVGGLASSGAARTPDACAWPGWSPDGRWLAAFRAEARGTGQAASLLVAEVGGVRERVIFRQPGAHPVYARWSPDGRWLALLCQQEEELLLYVVDAESGAHRLIEHGVPLFFEWTLDATSLLIHSGRGPDQGRITRRVVAGPGADAVFPVGPGSFCAPIALPGAPPRVLFAASATGGSSHICTSDLDGERLRHVATLRGLLAMAPDPSGRRLAIGAAPGGEGSPYDGLWLTDLEGGPLRQISTHPMMAFYWVDEGRALVYAAADRAHGCVRWYRCVPGAADPSDCVEQELFPSWPTAEQVFLLHFFEQLAGSHGPVDPSGRWLVLASWPAPDPDGLHSDGAQRRPRVLRVDLRAADPQPELLTHGSVAVVGPPAPAR